MASASHLTPYDTGQRLEPHIWSTAPRALLEKSSPTVVEREHDRFGRVDLDDEEGRSVVTVYAERSEDGTYIIHLTPFQDDEITVQLHGEDGTTRTLDARH